MADLLTVRDLQVSFASPAGPIEALRGISFRVRPGSCVALVGESGSGKSVASQAILGILPEPGRITGGQILYRDGGEVIDLARLDPNGSGFRRLRGRAIAIIFQEPMSALSPLHRIGDQIGETIRLHRGVARGEVRKLAADMLRLAGFPTPEAALDSYPFELSGGLRQRAMIAQALAGQPALLIADEPTTALDVTLQAQILQLLRRLQGELGMALLLITHDLGVVANLAEEIVVLQRGRVLESGPAEALFADPRHDYLKALLHAVPRMGQDRPARAVPEAALLEAKGLTKQFTQRHAPARRVVDSVDLTLHRGECLGLVGESGSGKSTLAKLLMAALEPDAGTIRFAGEDVLALTGPALQGFRRRVQYIFQDPFAALDPRMSAFEILAEPLVIHRLADGPERRRRVEAAAELVGLDPAWLNRFPHSFSGGQRQRLGIARALVLEPELMICDEPVSALDVRVQEQILDLLRDLQARLGLTYLFISHNLAVVDAVADRIAVMCAGRIVELAPRKTLFEAPVHPYTQALLAAIPQADLAARLDFDHICAGTPGDPGSWPYPFTRGAGVTPIDLGDGHVIEASERPALSSLSAPLGGRGSFALLCAVIFATPALAQPPDQPSVEDGPVGQPGGMLRMLIANPRDTRQLPIFGYARLVAYRPDYSIVPDILQAVEAESDRIFTLHIRPGHKWSDGEPFTAEDFRYWWEDIALDPDLTPAGPPVALLRDGERPKVEILDPLTVRYSWSKPMPSFLAELAGPTPVVIYRPAHYLKQFHARYADPKTLATLVAAQHLRSWTVLHNRLDNPTAETNPDLPSLDPWVLKTRPPAERFVFERNPYYYRVDTAGRQLPYLDRVVALVADARLIPAKTGAGEADLQARGLRFDNYTFLKAGEAAHGYKVRLWQTAYGSQQALYPDLTCNDPAWRALFRDTRIRRALSLGVDRHEINNALYYGLAVEGQNTVLPDSPLYDRALRQDWAQYDPAAANKLLDEVGLAQRDEDGIRLMPDGRRLQITVEYAGQAGEESDLLELIRDSWRGIGVALFAKPYQVTVLHNRLFAGDTLMTIDRGLENGLPTALMSPAALAPLLQEDWQWPRWGQYAETRGLSGEAPELDPAKELLRLADAWTDAGGLGQRSEIWRKMLRIQSDEVYSIGLVAAVPQPVVISTRLRNVPDQAIYNFDPGALFGIYKPDRFWLQD